MNDPVKGPKHKSKPGRNSIPAMEFKLTYNTAASLHHLICAQHVHAKRIAEETGLTSLLESTKTTEAFFNALSTYLDKYTK